MSEPSARAMDAAERYYGDRGELARKLALLLDSFAAAGFADAIALLRAAAFEPRPKPTIAELEAILSASPSNIYINPDGSLGVTQGRFTEAADWLVQHPPKDKA